MSRTRHLLRSSLLVFALYVLEKISGLAKLFLMTRTFGTGPEADAFTAAYQLPELFLYALTGGAVAAAFIPVYSAYLTNRQPAQAAALGNTVFSLTLLVLGVICAAAAVSAPWISRVLLVPEFSPEQQALTAQLIRILLLSTVIVGISGVFGSLLQAHQHFLAPALALTLTDLGQIFGIAFLAPRWGIAGVAWGVVIGSLLLAATQLPALRHKGIRLSLALALKLTGSREVLRLMGPRVVSIGVVQAVDLIFIRLASPLPAGSITAFFYAVLVMVAMPKSLLTGVITTVFFPTLAEEYNAGRVGAMQAALYAGLRTVCLLVLPAGVGLLALGEPAVAFLFERGAFDARSTSLVFGLMGILTLRLLFDSCQDVLALAFYARHNTTVMMWGNLGWAVVQVGLSLMLVGPYGIAGLAWATTLASATLTVALFWLNRRLTPQPEAERAILLALGRGLLACGGMALFIRCLPLWGVTGLPYLLLGIIGGALVYGALLAVLGGREVATVWAHLLKREA